MRKLTKKEFIEIIARFKEAGLWTNSPSNQVAFDRFKKGESDTLNIILTNGMPMGISQCSKCKENLSDDQFGYYHARVTKEGFLQRSNALCANCRQEEQDEFAEVISQHEEDIPPAPKPGSRCPNCNRAWSRSWHRHHDHNTKKFIAWWCGNCNMAQQDRRNRRVK